ncbi:MAG: efflux RND transporter permease subunit [Acidobacteria bacterium]|nr:efflux RND transporter permease subunit [Acidobacteriota bacterium]
MKVTQFSLNRPVTTLMLVSAIIIFGFASYKELSIDLLPDIEFPTVTITTEYPDASASDVEEEISTILVSGLKSIPNIRRISSISEKELSTVTVNFHWGADIKYAVLNIREEVDKVIDRFPEKAETPIITPLNPATSPIMTLSVSSTTSSLAELQDTARFIIKPRLEQQRGIASAEVNSIGRKEIQISLIPEMVELYNIKPNEISSIIKRLETRSSGTIKKGEYRYSIIIEWTLQDISDLKALEIKLENGLIVPLSNIADIQERIVKLNNFSRWNGKEIISIDIYKEYGRNTMLVSKEAETVVEELNKTYPNFNVEIINRQDDFISGAINSVIQSLIIGGILAFIVLFLFLNNFRVSLIIGISIPVSIIGTFTAFYLAGVNINLMTLGGLALAVGMLVDNAIITIENIFRYKTGKTKAYDAAFKGTSEIGMAITASTLTTVAVFLPIVYVRGVAAALFRDQAISITFALLISLLTSLTIIPLLSMKLMSKRTSDKKDKFGFKEQWKRYAESISLFKADSWKQITGRFHNFKIWKIYIVIIFLLHTAFYIFSEIIKIFLLFIFFILESITDFIVQIIIPPVKKIISLLSSLFSAAGNGFQDFYKKIEDLYHNLEIKALEKKSVVLLTILGLFLAALFITFNMETRLIPETDTGIYRIVLNLPDNLVAEKIESEAAKIEKDFQNSKAVKNIFTVMDKNSESGKNLIFKIQLVKGYTVDDLPVLLKEIKHLEGFSYTIEPEYSILEQLIMILKSRFSIKVYAHDTDEAYKAALKVLTTLKNETGLFENPEITNYETEKILKAEFKEDIIFINGLDKNDISNFIVSNLQGEVPLSIKKVGEKITIRLKTGLEDYKNITELKNIVYSDKTGRKFTLESLCSFKEDEYLSAIHSDESKPFIEISMDLTGSLNKARAFISRIRTKIDLPDDVNINVSGEYEEMKDSFKSLSLALLLSAFLIYMIIAAQFESLKNPFIIICTIPLGFIGTVFTLLIFSQSMNIISIIGFIVLTGIIVNDAIVKVDRINQLRDEGMALRESIITAGLQRLRPILMTTVTTVFGLLPMAIIPGEGSEIYRPLAWVIIGGESIGTILTIFLIPVMYEIFNKKNEKEQVKTGK